MMKKVEGLRYKVQGTRHKNTRHKIRGTIFDFKYVQDRILYKMPSALSLIFLLLVPCILVPCSLSLISTYE